MSTGFTQFGKAARLYAEHSQIVKEMEQLCVADISAFLAAVRARMQAKLKAGRIEEQETPQYLCWWIVADEDTDDEDDVPYVWLEHRRVEIVTPGVLTVIADVENASEAETRKLAAVKSSLVLPRQCDWVDGEGLFGISIRYGESSPVEASSKPILEILVALHRAQKTMFAIRAKHHSRKKLAKR